MVTAQSISYLPVNGTTSAIAPLCEKHGWSFCTMKERSTAPVSWARFWSLVMTSRLTLCSASYFQDISVASATVQRHSCLLSWGILQCLSSFDCFRTSWSHHDALCIASNLVNSFTTMQSNIGGFIDCLFIFISLALRFYSHKVCLAHLLIFLLSLSVCSPCFSVLTFLLCSIFVFSSTSCFVDITSYWSSFVDDLVSRGASCGPSSDDFPRVGPDSISFTTVRYIKYYRDRRDGRGFCAICLALTWAKSVVFAPGFRKIPPLALAQRVVAFGGPRISDSSCQYPETGTSYVFFWKVVFNK